MATEPTQPIKVSYVAVVMSISLVVAIITIVNWLFNPIATKLSVEIVDRAREDARVEKTVSELNDALTKFRTQEEARWSGVPNVTSIEGEISTERAAREGFDFVSKQQRDETAHRLEMIETRQIDVLQRLSALEAMTRRYSLLKER